VVIFPCVELTVLPVARLHVVYILLLSMSALHDGTVPIAFFHMEYVIRLLYCRRVCSRSTLFPISLYNFISFHI